MKTGLSPESGQSAAAGKGQAVPDDLGRLLDEARRISHEAHGPRLTMALPGMFTAYGRRGRYPAVSITGRECRQMCGHCRGRLLEGMTPAPTPEALLALARRLRREGSLGMLVSGGNDPTGRLPWRSFIPALARIKAETGLTLTVHAARIGPDIARSLKAAGVSQALVDVVGSEETAREVLSLPDGLAAQRETLEACAQADLEIAPHIIVGLHSGAWRGEEKALEIVLDLSPRRVIFVVLMPLKGTPLAGSVPPREEDVAAFLARARQTMPQALHHLGCARPRGRYRARLDALAVRAGINVLAIPSDGAMEEAGRLGLEVKNSDTCCSVVCGK